MQVKEALIAARRLIEKEEDWCQEALRKFEHGRVQRCAAGAIDAVFEDMETNDAAYAALRQAMDNCNLISEFNDNHSHEEVLAAFDRAIAAA